MCSYIPKTISTEGIELSSNLDHLTEMLAENVHNNWAEARMAAGWTWGPNRDDKSKKHPCLIPYSKLSEAEKDYDRTTTKETLKAIIALGYRIERVPDS
jgi:ryanodine receptor 2